MRTKAKTGVIDTLLFLARSEVPGEQVLMGITALTLYGCVVLSLSGTWLPWLPALAGLYAGWCVAMALAHR